MFRPSRIPNCLAAGPSSSSQAAAKTSTHLHVRNYAISVQSPRVWPGKTENRVFEERKTYLYNQFTTLLSHGASEPLLFLGHKNFRASGMIKLRREITAAVLPKNTKFSLLDAPPPEESLPRLNVVRTSVFGVALRHFAPIDAESCKRIADMAGRGGLAVLRLPSLDPPQLRAVLSAINRAVPKLKKAQENDNGKGKKKDDDDGYIPGRKMKRHRPMLDPELTLLGALIEGRVFGVESVKDVAKLPTLQTLHAQIVGLLSSPAVQLAVVLGEASGGKLARTLEGLKKGLEEEQVKPEETSNP